MKALVAATLLLAWTLVGCDGASVRLGGSAPLLTGIDPTAPVSGDGRVACWTNSTSGPLVVDPTSGTAIIEDFDNSTIRQPVMWLPGFTGRRNGSEVEVYDPRGHLVATTGHSYRIEGAGAPNGAWWACGGVHPLP